MRTLKFVLLSLIVITLFSCGKKEIKKKVLKARVTNIAGSVFLKDNQNSEYKQLKKDVMAKENSFIKTEDKSSCDLLFSNGTIVNLDYKTEVKIVDLKMNNKTAKSKILINAIKGSMFSKVKEKSGQFEVNSFNAVGGVRGTEYLVIVTKDRKTKIFTNKGEVYCFRRKDSSSINRDELYNLKDPQVDEFYKNNNISKVAKGYEFLCDSNDNVKVSRSSAIKYKFRGERLTNQVERTLKMHRSSGATINE